MILSFLHMGLFQFESGNGPLPLPAAGLKEKAKFNIMSYIVV